MMNRILLRFALLLVGLLSGPSPVDAEPDKAELAQKTKAILKTNCFRCHGGDGRSEGGFNFVLDQPMLLGKKKVIPGNSKDSELYKKLIGGIMPPAKDTEGTPVKQRPTKEEIALVKQWIEAGAPDFAGK